MSLTVCALAKDSESVLHRFFTSIEGCADQILIGDLGSCDNTIKKAKDSMPSLVIAVNVYSIFSFLRAVRRAICSFPDPDARLRAISKSDILPLSWFLIYSFMSDVS